MDAVKKLLERYQLEDPVSTDKIGIFTDQDLQILYNSLVEEGSKTLVDALKVGAVIEEIDIIDLENQMNNIADNEDINWVYDNLMRGSRNHLRAFVRNIKAHGEEYLPQYLDQEKFEEIINSDMEKGKEGRGKRRGKNG